MNWLRRRDKSINEPTAVPSSWDRFQYAANTLAREGKSQVTCLKCNSKIRNEDIDELNDKGRENYKK